MRKYVYSRVMYEFSVMLAIDEKMFRRIMRDLRVKDDLPFVMGDADASTHLFERRSCRMAVVCIRTRKGIDGIQTAALLAHEAVHVFQEHRKAFKEEPASEYEAYAIQEIHQWLMYEFIKQNGHLK